MDSILRNAFVASNWSLGFSEAINAKFSWMVCVLAAEPAPALLLGAVEPKGFCIEPDTAMAPNDAEVGDPSAPCAYNNKNDNGMCVYILFLKNKIIEKKNSKV